MSRENAGSVPAAFAFSAMSLRSRSSAKGLLVSIVPRSYSSSSRRPLARMRQSHGFGGADGLRVMADRRGAVVAEGVVPARSFGERVHFAQVIESQARGEVHQVLLNHGPIRPGDACHAKI